MQPAVLIYNPRSGSYHPKRLPPLREALRAAGYDAEPRPTTGPGAATEIARQAAADGVTTVFANGGDGTVRETAAGLLGTEVVLGVLPAGTANVLVRAFNLPMRPLDIARRIGDYEPRLIDVGRLSNSSGDAMPFLMMASCGLDAQVMAREMPISKRILGRFAYGWEIFKGWMTYGYPTLKAHGDQGEALPGSLIVTANVAQYGGAFKMAPDADFADGLLDLVVFNGRRGATAGLIRDLILGRHMKRSDISVQQVRHVEIDAPANVRIQIDGDVVDVKPPWTLSLAQERLRVLLPPQH